jgi:opacity protein-like surface antigen
MKLAQCALLASLFAATGASQQTQPRIEVFVLTGVYMQGNQVFAPQSFALGRQWKPQFGGGVLAPLGRKWAAVFDATTNTAEGRWAWDGTGPAENFARVRRIVLTPSVLRMWRRERFSIFAGGGLGIEHDLERSRYRPIVARDENGRPVLAPDFQERDSTHTGRGLLLRAGTIGNVTPRFVVRAGYLYLRRYADERPSHGLEFGIGYRF